MKEIIYRAKKHLAGLKIMNEGKSIDKELSKIEHEIKTTEKSIKHMERMR
jgi:hypothetical protein